MEILPTNTKDFKTLASSAVTDIMNGKDVEDAVVDISDRYDMNPEEVKRLVEKTNLALSLEHLRSDDKKGTFALAKYDNVVRRTHPAEGDYAVIEKTSGMLPTTRRKPSVNVFGVAGKLSKTAAIKRDDGVTVTEMFAVKRELENLKKQASELAYSLHDDIDFIASEFSKQNAPDFSKFASECVALYGSVAKPVISGLAEYLGEKPRLRKIASIVDDTAKTHAAMRRICDGLPKLAGINDRIDVAKKCLEAFGCRP